MREDVERQDAELVDTEEGPSAGIIHARGWDGADGYQQLQNALDDLDTDPGTVVVGPDGPDSYTGEDGEDYDRVWLLTNSLEIPSNTTVVIHGDCVLADGVGQNLIRNKNYDDDAVRDQNIHIVGVGRPYLDQRPGHQNRTANDAKHVGIRLYQVDTCSVKNLELRTTSYAVRPEAVTDLTVGNLWFDQDGSVGNQDGLHIVGPTFDFSVDGLHGVTHDDICAIECGAFSVPLDGASGDVHDGSIRNLTGNPKGGAPGASLKFIGGNAGTIGGVSASHIIVKGRRGVEFEDYVGGGSDPAQDTESGIVVSNITTSRAGSFDSLVHFVGGVSNVEVQGISGDINTVNGVVTVGEDVDNVTVSEVDLVIRSGGKMLNVLNGATASDLTLADARARNQASGRFINTASDTTLEDVEILSPKADGFDRFLAVSGSATGRVVDATVKNISDTIYDEVGSLKFVGDNPPFDSAAPAVKGSEVIATAAWDPDGDGNAERVQYDGSSWQEVVDLPNW
ncbi:hypothetical protein [Halorientalis persicus]|uniref:hypothetical protein n=1 Tax=Halorientalis persicus TaxID=1367881 RepID=UPI0011142EEF|nr:hypothetical protein [Halorientalis persicus]